MSFFGARPGYWDISSNLDPRWNVNGKVESLVIFAGMHPDALKALAELDIKYGTRPDDLTYQCMKD